MRRSNRNQLSLFDLPAWHDPPCQRLLHIETFGAVYALIETLGVISLHRTRAEAELALDVESARRTPGSKSGGKPKARP